jgi:hypothetical protein
MAASCPTIRRSIPTILGRHALRPLKRPSAVSSRRYAGNIPQPLQDVMTGEIIQLPDIDVSFPPPTQLSTTDEVLRHHY